VAAVSPSSSELRAESRATVCWSCERSAGAGAFCAACGALQPPDGKADHFEVLGVTRAFEVDLDALERRYRELTRQLHPDRFARADARARRASLARSVQLNDAWKTLRDPVRRAEYLLVLAGIEVGGEDGTRKTDASGASQRVPVSQELLLEVMELREALLEARGDGDEAQIAALTADVRARRGRALAAVAEALGQTPAALDAAAHELVSLRYYDRFLAEVAAHEETREGATAEVGNGG
jgi:molecular chaperone HscB